METTTIIFMATCLWVIVLTFVVPWFFRELKDTDKHLKKMKKQDHDLPTKI